MVCLLCQATLPRLTPAQIRAANTLLSITHSMKLLLLLSDEAQIAHRRDAEIKTIQEEKNTTNEQVVALLDELLSRPSNTPAEASSSSSMST